MKESYLTKVCPTCQKLVAHVGIQVSCSAEDHSAVREAELPSLNIEGRLCIYIAGHLPLLDTLSNQAAFPSYPSYLLTAQSQSAATTTILLPDIPQH